MAKRRTSLRNLEKQLTPRAQSRSFALSQSFDNGLPVYARFSVPSPAQRARATALSQFAPSWSAATEGYGAYEVESFELPLPVRPVQPRAAAFTPRPAAPPKPVAMNLVEIDDELAAIRAQTGTPVAPAEPPLAVAAAAAPPVDTSDADEPAAPPPVVHPHSVFDTMGRAMRYANTFDLGAIELGQRFDEFDRELRRAEAPPRKAYSSAASVDHVDEDLRVIGALSKMQNAPPAQAPTQPPAQAPARDLAPAPAPPAPAPALEPVVRHEVPLIAEQPGLSGDAACAAMVLAWKHKLEPSAAAIAEGRGGWSAFKEALAGSAPMLLHAVGFELHGPELPNTDTLRSLLERSGPIWVGAPEAGVRGRVITGLSIDPARQQALLHIADSRDERTPGPNAAPRATTYTMPFMQFIRSLPDNATGWIMAYIPVPTGT